MASLSASSLLQHVLSSVPILPDCEINETVTHSALQNGHQVTNSCRSLDECCEDISLCASNFSLQALPLVPALLDGGSTSTKPHQDYESTQVPMNSYPSDEHYKEASLSASSLFPEA